MADYVIKEVSNDEPTNENDETDNNEQNEEKENEKQKRKRNTKQERQKRKAEIEGELQQLEDELQQEAEVAAENISEDEPDTSEVKAEAKDEADAIAAGHKLSNDEESRLAEAISTKVMEKMGERSKPREVRSAPDKRPRPTHWSERRILGRNRGET